MDNQEKYETYKNLFVRLKKALSPEFYYEAVFLEYAIMEDRLESMLTHAGVPVVDKNGYGIKLSRKINLLKSRKEFVRPDVRKRLPLELLDRVGAWADDRNTLVHHLAHMPYDDESVKRVALEGKELVDLVRSRSRSVNNIFDKERNGK